MTIKINGFAFPLSVHLLEREEDALLLVTILFLCIGFTMRREKKNLASKLPQEVYDIMENANAGAN